MPPRLPTTLGPDPVPQYSGSVQVARENPARVGGMAARSLGQMGEGLQKMAALSDEIVAVEDQIKADEAVDRVKSKMLDLSYNAESGYLTFKGGQAVNRPGGRALADEYTEKLNSEIEAVAGGLTSQRQQAAFRKATGGLVTSFRGDVTRHATSELKNYRMSVLDGKIKNAEQAVALNYISPKVANESLSAIKEAVYAKGILSGDSAEDIMAKQKEAESKIHASRIGMLLDADKVDDAHTLYKQGLASGGLMLDDVIGVKDKLDTQRAKQALLAGSESATGKALRMFAPPPADRLLNLVLDTESGGRQFAEDGTPLTSSKGAVGVAQVMPGTGPEAAQLAGLPWDEKRFSGDADYNRALGRAYLGKQLADNEGDVRKALAAYNAGPGRLKEAVAKAEAAGTPGEWLSYLPEETQNYVGKIVGGYENGEGSRGWMSPMEYEAEVMRHAPADATPDMLASIRAGARTSYAGLEQQRKAEADALEADMQRKIAESGQGVQALTAEDRSRILGADPNILGRLGSYAKKIGDTKEFDTFGYMDARNRATEMTDSEFNLAIAGFSPADQKSLIAYRESKRNPGKNTPDDLDVKSLDRIVKGYAVRAGWDFGTRGVAGKDVKAYAHLLKAMTDEVLYRQAVAGKKFSDRELEETLGAKLMTDVSDVKEGWFSDRYEVEKVVNIRPDSVPDDFADRVRLLAEKQNRPEPTPEEVYYAYLNALRKRM